MTVSKTVYQGSNPCQPVLSMCVDKGKLTFQFSAFHPFGDCGLSITNFLSLSGDRLGDPTKFEFSFHKPFGNCGLSIAT